MDEEESVTKNKDPDLKHAGMTSYRATQDTTRELFLVASGHRIGHTEGNRGLPETRIGESRERDVRRGARQVTVDHIRRNRKGRRHPPAESGGQEVFRKGIFVDLLRSRLRRRSPRGDSQPRTIQSAPR